MGGPGCGTAVFADEVLRLSGEFGDCSGLDAIRIIAGGEALLSPKATQSLIARFLDTPEATPLPTPAALNGLTDRERETLALVAAGLSNDDIAERLYLSPLTAKTW